MSRFCASAEAVGKVASLYNGRNHAAVWRHNETALLISLEESRNTGDFSYLFSCCVITLPGTCSFILRKVISSSVSTVSGYGLDGRGSIPGRGKGFFL
jgi:hypothetical protein